LDANGQSREEILDALEDLMLRMGRRFATHKLDALTPTQFMVLRWLQERGQVPMSDIADAVGITMAGATGLIDRLVNAGLVERARSNADRRIVSIRLTPAGAEAVEASHRRRFQHFRALTAGLSDEDLKNLYRILSTMVRTRLEGGERHE
jgi:DNA-binding MarR family transcriptional regulator